MSCEGKLYQSSIGVMQLMQSRKNSETVELSPETELLINAALARRIVRSLKFCAPVPAEMTCDHR